MGQGHQVPNDNPSPGILRPTSDEIKPPSPSQKEILSEPIAPFSPPVQSIHGNDQQVPRINKNPPLRGSTRVRKTVDRFKFDKVHGYSSIKKFSSLLINSL